MEVLGWMIWIAGLLLGLSWAYGVRTYIKTGRGVQQTTVNQTMLILAAVIAVPLIGVSPFNLLWLLPVVFVSGMLSVAFPFSVLSLAGKPFGRICCLGLNPEDIAQNTHRRQRFLELVKAGASPEEAKAELDRE